MVESILYFGGSSPGLVCINKVSSAWASQCFKQLPPGPSPSSCHSMVQSKSSQVWLETLVHPVASYLDSASQPCPFGKMPHLNYASNFLFTFASLKVSFMSHWMSLSGILKSVLWIYFTQT